MPSKSRVTMMKFFLVVVLYIIVAVSYSHPLQLIEYQPVYGLKADERQITYQDDTSILLRLPEQPNRAARIELSLILEKMSFNELINNGLIRCMSSNTGTNETSWGAFAADRFSLSQIQVQFFVIVSETQSLEFPGILDAYLSSGDLLRCLRNADERIPKDADIISGRNVAAPRSSSIVSAVGSTPGWAAAAVLGVVAAIGVLALVGVLRKGEDIYLETDFDDFREDAENVVDSEKATVDSAPSDVPKARATSDDGMKKRISESKGTELEVSRNKEQDGSREINKKHDD